MTSHLDCVRLSQLPVQDPLRIFLTAAHDQDQVRRLKMNWAEFFCEVKPGYQEVPLSTIRQRFVSLRNNEVDKDIAYEQTLSWFGLELLHLRSHKMAGGEETRLPLVFERQYDENYDFTEQQWLASVPAEGGKSTIILVLGVMMIDNDPDTYILFGTDARHVNVEENSEIPF